MRSSPRTYPPILLLLLAALLARLCPEAAPGAIPVNQWVGGNYLERKYPEALTSLVQAMNRATGADLDPSIQFLESLTAKGLRGSPVLYINAGDITAWPTAQQGALIRDWVEHGGFLFIDAGLQAPFLQESAQVHSYAAWTPAPAVQAFLHRTFGRDPETVPLDHQIFRSWFDGLPDPKVLPDSVRDYVVNEKWPKGTYSLMGLRWGTQYRVILAPIVAMGWGTDGAGGWSDRVSFRVREYDARAEIQLRTTAAQGRQYEVPLQDGSREIVYCATGDMPSWVREPSGRIRLFKYYHGTEINDYAHEFYTRLGINILYYGMMERR